MKSGIIDKFGVEVEKGDVVIFPYINPMGKLEDEEDFRKKIIFKFGCFGYFNELDFVPLFNWMDTKMGEYVSNHGNKTVHLNTYPFWVKRDVD